MTAHAKWIMARELAPLLAFDFKGHLATGFGLDDVFDMWAVALPRAIALDVLALSNHASIAVKEAAAHFRDSFARIPMSALA